MARGAKECLRGHGTQKGVTGQCRECQRQTRARYNARNRDAINAKAATWRKKNRAFHKKLIADWKTKNKDRTAEATRARQAGLRQRTPTWADRRAMADMYAAARTVSLLTGIRHHVDHVIPLHGKKVSGLHVFDNLQILAAIPNLAKGNRFWD